MKRPLPDRDVFRRGEDNDYSLLKVASGLKKLEDFERATSKYRLPQDVKPCILKLLNHEGSLQTLENWKIPCIVACELKRVGFTRSEVEKTLERWQRTTSSQVASAVRVAFEKDYERSASTLPRGKLKRGGECLAEVIYL